MSAETPAAPGRRRIVRAILVAALVLAIGALAIVVWQRDAFLTGALQATVLIGFPVLICCVAGWGLWTGGKRAPEALLLLVSLAIPIYGAEAFLWFGESLRVAAIEDAQKKAADAIRSRGGTYDGRTFREYFVDAWKGGDRVYPRIYQLSQRTVMVGSRSVFPTSNLSRKPIVECHQDGAFKVWLSDEYGFTNPVGAHASDTDVVLVGDSFTAGECVSTDEDVGARMRESGFRAVNLGIGGSGPLWQLANLVEYGLPLQPEVVYWLFYEGNDFANLEFESLFPELTRYLSAGPIDARRQKADIDRAVEELQRSEILSLGTSEQSEASSGKWLSELRRAITLGRLRMRIGLHRSYRAEEAALNKQLSIVLARARDLSRAQGATLVFVYVPDWTRFVGRADHIDREAVLEVVRDLQLPVIDVYERFRVLEDPLSVYPHRLPGHFTADGYRQMADAIASDYRARTSIAANAQ